LEGHPLRQRLSVEGYRDVPNTGEIIQEEQHAMTTVKPQSNSKNNGPQTWAAAPVDARRACAFCWSWTVKRW